MNYILIFILSTLPFQINAQELSRNEYINKYSKVAIEEMERTGIPASITMAQGILESNHGNSRLARKANNHFGIKCHNNWNGRTIKHTDDKNDECFRKYSSADESYKDHSNFLQRGKRYQFLFNYASTDYKKWAKGLKRAGYATNPRYADKLIELIKRYQLYKLDQRNNSADKQHKAAGNNNKFVQKKLAVSTGKHQIAERNRVEYTVARQGDTFASLTEEFDKMRWELRKYNDVPEGVEPEAGQIIYLQPKRNRASRDHKYYTVKAGETMWYVSQKFAVKLNKLYKKNRMEPGAEPEPGTKLWLRSKKPRN